MTDAEKPPNPETGVTDEIIREEIEAHGLARRLRPLRRLYEWVLSWGETRHAGKAMAALGFSEAIFFPVPADLLLVALCMGKPERSFRWAAICTVSSIVGGVVAWGLGVWLGRPAVDAFMGWLGRGELVVKADELFGRWGFWAVGASALTPIPYMVFSWVAGTLRLPWWQFVLASIIFRPLRFFAVGALAWKFGEKAKAFIDTYFNAVSLGVMALVVLLVILARYVL